MYKDIVTWFIDIVTSSMGIIVSITCLILITYKISKLDNPYPLSLRCIVYSVYISAFIYFLSVLLNTILLPLTTSISPSFTNQKSICDVAFHFAIPVMGMAQYCIINLLIHRLNISFKKSTFALSHCTNYGFRIILITTWIALSIAVTFIIETFPYNIYSNEWAYNDGNGITCKTQFTQTYGQQYSPLVLGSIILTILISNIIIWILFMTKLYKTYKSVNQNKNKISAKENEFIQLMKQQTMLVFFILLLTILWWLLLMTRFFGLYISTIYFTLMISIIFFTFPFNNDYFELFLCDLLVICCCNCFDKYMIRKLHGDVSVAELQKYTNDDQDNNNNYDNDNNDISGDISIGYKSDVMTSTTATITQSEKSSHLKVTDGIQIINERHNESILTLTPL